MVHLSHRMQLARNVYSDLANGGLIQCSAFREIFAFATSVVSSTALWALNLKKSRHFMFLCVVLIGVFMGTSNFPAHQSPPLNEADANEERDQQTDDDTDGTDTWRWTNT